MQNPTTSLIGRGRLNFLSCALMASAAASFLIAATAPASAENTSTDAKAGGIETVIVTSERREERLLDVPQSVSALTDADLKAMGATSFIDYVGAIPNVQFTTIGPGQTKITIRGVSDAQGVSTVGYYLNDTPITSRDTSGANQPDPNVFDVERVEILRGPQGTLYGGGSMGGTIRILTKQPDTTKFDTAADVTASATEHGGTNYNVNGMVNVPLADTLAVRVAGGYGHYDGWIDDPFIGKDINTYKTDFLRTEAKYAPTDDFSLTFLYQYDWLATNATNLSDTNTKWTSTLSQLSPNKDKTNLYSLTGVYDLHWAELTAVASYSTRANLAFQPFSSSTLGSYEFAFGLPAGTITGGGANLGANTRDYNGEVRLVSEGDGPLQWTVGAYHLDSAIAANTLVYILPPNAVSFIPGGIFLNSVGTQHVSQYALYGEATYNFTDSLALTGGLRWFNETVAVSGVANGSPIFGRVKTGKIIPKATLSYKIDPDSLVYFTYSGGFRSGGANLGVDPGSPPTYQPDTTENYELGAKTVLFDGKLVATAALYYIAWSNMQIFIDATPPNTIGYTTNGGKAKSQGAELDLNIQPIDSLKFELNGSYSEAVLTQPYVDIAFTAPTGNWLPNVPRFKGYASAEYSFPVMDDVTGRLRGDVQYTGKSWASILNALHPRDVLQPAYTLANLSLAAFRGSWTAELFVHNVFDERAILENDTFGNIYENRPRTIGITLRYNP
ncbi:MAG: TonB-dependent receptor [Rhizomicrobium sp.]